MWKGKNVRVGMQQTGEPARMTTAGILCGAVLPALARSHDHTHMCMCMSNGHVLCGSLLPHRLLMMMIQTSVRSSVARVRSLSCV